MKILLKKSKIFGRILLKKSKIFGRLLKSGLRIIFKE
jgi:hypothetical protein